MLSRAVVEAPPLISSSTTSDRTSMGGEHEASNSGDALVLTTGRISEVETAALQEQFLHSLNSE